MKTIQQIKEIYEEKHNTKVKTYNFKDKLWWAVTRNDMADQLIYKLRRDVLIKPIDWKYLGEYTDVYGEIIRDAYYNYSAQKSINEKKLNDFTDYLKKIPGAIQP